jgi:hypothetical protein
MYQFISTGFRFSNLPYWLGLLVLNLQIGCPFISPSDPPEVQFKSPRAHFIEGDPVVTLGQLVGSDGEILGTVVRKFSYEMALKEQQHADARKSEELNVASTTFRSMTLLSSDGITITLVEDKKFKRLDQQELAGGPWIYYLNEDEPYRRIHVPESKIDEFKTDLASQYPLEFVAKWCDNQAGKLLAERFDSLEEFRKKERRLLRR